MKRLIVLCFIVLILTGCRYTGKNNSRTQSLFKENFSIGTIVEDNVQYLIPESRELFSSEYGSVDEPFTQKQEEIALQIDQADLSAFVAAIQSGIEEAIINSGASIVGHSSGGVTGTSFSIQYRENQTFGVINVWGVRGEGTNFFLFVLITESMVSGSL